MLDVLYITDDNVGELMTAGEGLRVPWARVTVGDVSGMGWGFLPPFTQQALFPQKGEKWQVFSHLRRHEPFKIVRLTSFEGARQHKDHSEPTAGTFWNALVWRSSWGEWREAVIE